LIILHDIVSLQPTIVLIIGHFLTSVKFCKIPWQYQNSAEKGKFHGSARNCAASGKLWALVIRLPDSLHLHEQQVLGGTMAKMTNL